MSTRTALDQVERDVTLATAIRRYDALRTRDTLDEGTPLSRAELLEMLSLGEVIARKAVYGRQLAIRSARRAGASWAQIGDALGTSKQAAWEAHRRWIEQQEADHRDLDYTGMDEDEAAAARALAGSADS